MKKFTAADVEMRFQVLIDSCDEGYDGTWDSSTQEGREGFMAMRDGIVDLIKYFNVKNINY